MAKEEKSKVLGKLTTTVESFVKALKNVTVEKSETLPILNSVRITGATITGTDLDIFITVPFEAKGKGDFLLPHRAALKALEGEHGPLTVECVETKFPETPRTKEHVVRVTKLTIGVAEFKFDSMGIANFPKEPETTEPTLVIKGETMKTLIARSRIAISPLESRYTLNAALLKATGGKITMVATDGHRLSLQTAHGEGQIDESLIPPAALDWVKKNCSGDVSIGLGKDFQTIKTATGTILSRRTMGQFPNYDAVLPKEKGVVATFDSPAKLGNVLKRVAKCADSRSGSVTFAVTSGSVALSASSDGNSAKAKYECDTHGINQGDVLRIGFNWEYVKDFLSNVDEKAFTLALTGPQSAGLFEMDNFRYIVMPMRV